MFLRIINNRPCNVPRDNFVMIWRNTKRVDLTGLSKQRYARYAVLWILWLLLGGVTRHCVAANLTIKEVIVSATSSSFPKLQCLRASELVAHLTFRHLGDIRPGVSPHSVTLTVYCGSKWQVGGAAPVLGCNYDAGVLAADGTAVVISRWRQRGTGRGRQSDNGDRLLIRSVTKGGGDLTNKECVRWQQKDKQNFSYVPVMVSMFAHKKHLTWCLNHFGNPAWDVYRCWIYMALLSTVHFKQTHQTWPCLILFSVRDLLQGNVFFFLFLRFQQRIIAKQSAGYK